MADPAAEAERVDETDVRGLLDTSVVLDLQSLPPSAIPERPSISAITLAELAAGPAASAEPEERARRRRRLQALESVFDPLPFDAAAAQAYARVFAAVAALGRKPRGARSLDLLIAVTALANALPLYTRNPVDFRGLEALVDVRSV